MNEHATAKAPTRGTHQHLTWGLISIPVQVLTGTEKGASVPRKQFTAAGNPVGSKSYDKETGADVDFADIVKMAETSDGQWVPLSDEEIEAAVSDGPVRGLAEIEAFIPLGALGREYVVLSVDQVRPARRQVGSKKVEDPGATRGFALLLAAMAEREVAALVRMATKAGGKYVAVTPAGEWLSLAYAEQVRQPAAMPEVDVTDVLSQGLDLIDAVGVSTPVLVDRGGAQIQEFVDRKGAGLEAVAMAEPETSAVDLLEALEASLRAKAA